MKGCELCNGVARMYCESDQASLCWDCDEKVHCANFLVAKHCRCLLCQICQSPTPWKASGPKLAPTVSICESCFALHEGKRGETGEDQQESHARNEQEDDYVDGDSDGYDDDDDDDDDDDVEDGEEEDGENQVVPWSVTSPSPPAASSSSSEGEFSSRFSCGGTILKRMRENNVDNDSDDEIGCSSSHIVNGRLNNDESNSLASFRPLKQARTGKEDEDDDHHQIDHDGQAKSKSTAIIDSLKRLQSEMVINRENASQTILGICRLSRDNHSR